MGCWSVRVAVTSWAERDMSVLSVRIWILAALGKHAEGDGGEGGPSTQQSASKSRGHFYPAISPSAPATQNECELWAPAESLISLGCHPSSHFAGN